MNDIFLNVYQLVLNAVSFRSEMKFFVLIDYIIKADTK